MHEKRRSTDNKSVDAMTRALTLLVGITICVILTIVSLLGYWRFYPYKPVETFPKPYKIVYPPNKVVRQGEFITYEFKYIKYSHVVPKVRRQFVDGLVFNVAGEQNPTITEPGRGIARAQVEIPDTLPPGKYQLRILADYQVNPIRVIENNSTTEIFEVVVGPRSPAQEEAVQLNNEEGK